MSKMFNYEADQIHDMVHPDLLTDSTHYVAECKDIILTEATPNYPKLTDYESEWIYFYEYIYEGGGDPVNLEYQTLVFNKQATVSNAIPFKYKSAILKGQTLVNVLGYERVSGSDTMIKNDDVITVESIDESKWRSVDINFTYLKPKTKYIISWDSLVLSNPDFAPSSSLISMRLKKANVQLGGWSASQNYIIVDIPSDTSDIILRIHASQGIALKNKTTVTGLKVVEYVEGMENYNIPYFEGMKTVQMPVLTTSNGDGTKTNILTVNEPVELRRVNGVHDELNLLTGELTERIGEIVFDGSENWVGSTIGSEGTFMRFRTIVKDAYLNEQGNGILCDRFTSISHSNWNIAIEGIHSKHTEIHINISTTKLESNDVSGFKKWLSSNPVTVCYTLATESVKTIDLSGSLLKPFEGTNHFYVSSDTIPPLCEVSVPIESTGAQSLMDINQED